MRIGVDGYNLALPRGTGVATYAAVLADAVRSMDMGLDGVFGLRVPVDVSFRQSVFFDAYRRSPVKGGEAVGADRPRGSVRRAAGLALRYARAFAPHPLRQVPLDDRVLKHIGAVSTLPPFERLFSASNLFNDAIFRFARTGRFTKVSLPNPPDVMHWTYPLPLVMAGSRNIYTLHDLVPLKLPYATLDDKRVYARLVSACSRRAARICTVSQASRRDIVELLGIDPDRITVTYQASAASGDEPDADAIESMFGLRRRGYLLFVGAIEPKKNVGRLIEAYLRLRTRTPLVLVGPRGWQAEAELRLVERSGGGFPTGTFAGPQGQSVVWLSYVEQRLVAGLIRHAKAMVFPSLYEGFGLPVLEAMERGTPVISSTTASIPEIAGDAAILVDPRDVDAICAAMRRLDDDPALGQELAGRGLRRAALFSQARYQEQLTELYKRAIAAP